MNSTEEYPIAYCPQCGEELYCGDYCFLCGFDCQSGPANNEEQEEYWYDIFWWDTEGRD